MLYLEQKNLEKYVDLVYGGDSSIKRLITEGGYSSEDSKMKDAAPGVDEKTFNRLVSYFDAWGKPSKGELQDVINYYRLNSATAYQLLVYWGYKDEFKKLHFYDSLSKAVK